MAENAADTVRVRERKRARVNVGAFYQVHRNLLERRVSVRNLVAA